MEQTFQITSRSCQDSESSQNLSLGRQRGKKQPPENAAAPLGECKVQRGWGRREGGGWCQTSLGEWERKGNVEEKQPQHTVQSTFWISWLRKA